MDANLQEKYHATPWNIPGMSGIYPKLPPTISGERMDFTCFHTSKWIHFEATSTLDICASRARARHCDAQSVPAPFQRQRAHLFLARIQGLDSMKFLGVTVSAVWPFPIEIASYGFKQSQPLVEMAIGCLDPAERYCHQGQSQSPEATLQESEG